MKKRECKNKRKKEEERIYLSVICMNVFHGHLILISLICATNAMSKNRSMQVVSLYVYQYQQCSIVIGQRRIKILAEVGKGHHYTP